MDIKETILKSIFFSASVFSAGITLFISGFMIVLALPILKQGLFFDMLTSPWAPDHGLFGLGPMIVGTICIAFMALVISFPISLGCSFFIGILNPKGLGKWLKKMVESMTAIPTVIYGPQSSMDLSEFFFWFPWSGNCFSKDQGCASCLRPSCFRF